MTMLDLMQPFNVGPDLNDPSHHTVICGRYPVTWKRACTYTGQAGEALPCVFLIHP
jgi:hypothetical protein